MAPKSRMEEIRYQIPEEWMYGELIGRQGKTLKGIQQKSGLNHSYMDTAGGQVRIYLL